MHRPSLSVAVTVALALSAAVGAAYTRPSAQAATVTLFASGLNNPRGLAFGPDGALYVAEGGLGGTATTSSADCDQVPPPVGPYSGGYTARISRIDSQGGRTTVADGLPSSQTSTLLGSLVSGVADLAFVGGQLYALEAGGGCSHGLIDTDNTVLRVNADGTTTSVANLSAFQRSHPVAQPEPGDFEPDGTWYSMVAVRGSLYAVEPNHGEVVRIVPDTGEITRVIDVSAARGHIVPTAIAWKGNFFFGNLGVFPISPGTSSIFKLTPSGSLRLWAAGLTTVLGLVVGPRDEMYVLESMTAAGFPGPAELGAGRIVEIDPNGQQQILATGFSFPTAMRMGPDGALYVSNLGFGGPVAGLGQVFRVALQ